MPGHNHQVNAAKLHISGMNRGGWADIANLNLDTTSAVGSLGTDTGQTVRMGFGAAGGTGIRRFGV